MSRIHSVLCAVVASIVAASSTIADEPDANPSPDAGRLDVGAVFGHDGGRVTSRRRLADGTQVLHGVQVDLGPKNQMREYAVYNQGRLEQRAQFYANGNHFRLQRREHDGDGYETVYGPRGLVGDALFHGTVKADQPWDGEFVGWELIPNSFGFRLAVHEYRDGERIGSTPLPMRKLGLSEGLTLEKWPWNTHDAWPHAPQSR